jgi:hypothetical protein
MATEDIRIEDGKITVERIEGKANVDVALSDVELVTFTRGVGGGTGALLLHTDKGDILIRVENDDAPKLLTDIREARGDNRDDAKAESQDNVDVTTTDTESTAVEGQADTNTAIEPPVRAPGRGNRSNRNS